MRKLVTLLLILGTALPITAQPVEIELHYIPAGRLHLLDGEVLRLYTFEEWKTLLAVDDELYSSHQKINIYIRQEALFTKEIRSLTKSLRTTNEALETSIKAYKKSLDTNEVLSLKLKKAEQKGAGSVVGPIILVVGVLVLVLGTGLIIGSQAKR